MTILMFCFALTLGATIGVFVMALVAASGDANREADAYWEGFDNATALNARIREIDGIDVPLPPLPLPPYVHDNGLD